MTQEQINIADMQCWLFREAQIKWHLDSKYCSELFEKYDLLGYISECYDLLHLNSYQCALQDLEDILKSKGVDVCKN